MANIILIPCSSRKKYKKCKVEKLYDGVLFKKCLVYARKKLETREYDEIRVLSDKHHVLKLTDIIDPYDVSLRDMSISKRQQWAKAVINKLKSEFDLDKDNFLILASKIYWENIVGDIKHCSMPLEHLRIGEQLKYL